MAGAKSFEQMLEERPEDAIKYFEELEDNPAWQHQKARMQKELNESDVQLRSCELAKVEFVRGYRKGIEFAQGLPAKIINQLKDDIALNKEAAKVEAARTPEEK